MAGHVFASIAIKNVWEESSIELIVAVITTAGEIRHIATSVTIEKVVSFKPAHRVNIVATGSVARHVAPGIAVEIIVGLRRAGFREAVVAAVSVIRHVVASVAVEPQSPLRPVAGRQRVVSPLGEAGEVSSGIAVNGVCKMPVSQREPDAVITAFGVI